MHQRHRINKTQLFLGCSASSCQSRSNTAGRAKKTRYISGKKTTTHSSLLYLSRCSVYFSTSKHRMSEMSPPKPQKKSPEAFLSLQQNLLFLNSKTMFLHPSINIHQRVKLEACSFFVSVCVCVQILLREGSHLCVREDPACVCACVQQAPIGMNYLEESLFYLSSVGWPRARKVLLPTTQETTLIHHPPFCSMPPSHPPTQVLPACSSVPLQMSPFIIALASWRTV